MISRETENVQSAREVEAAFRALTTGDKPYITANELFAVSFSGLFVVSVDDSWECWNILPFTAFVYYFVNSCSAKCWTQMQAPYIT